jgi:predicted aspartyl protease
VVPGLQRRASDAIVLRVRMLHWRRLIPARLALATLVLLTSVACPPGAARASPDIEVDLSSPFEPAPPPVYAAPTTSDRVGRIVAPVMINGQGPFKFIVDTGASHSAISPTLAAQLGLVPSEEVRLTVQGSTGSEAAPTVLIERLEAGAMVLARHRVPVISQQVFADADGILGVEGFDKLRVHVDFRLDRINITRHRERRMAGNWYEVPVEFRFGRLMIANGKIGRVQVKAVIDTGAERTLGNLALRTALRLDQAAQQEETVSSVIGATSAEQSANTIASPRIVLGQTALVDVDVTYADLNVFRLWELNDEPALIVGMDVLGTVRGLLFDYRRRELLIRLEGPILIRRDQG